MNMETETYFEVVNLNPDLTPSTFANKRAETFEEAQQIIRQNYEYKQSMSASDKAFWAARVYQIRKIVKTIECLDYKYTESPVTTENFRQRHSPKPTEVANA